MTERGQGLFRASLLCALAALCSLPACGDDDVVPFDSIPKDKPLTALTGGEQQGVCQWARQLANEKIMAKGAPLMCNGIAINVNSCAFPTEAQTRCTSTLGQWAECAPSFIDAIVQDPCKVFDLSFSQSEVEMFVNGLPGCEGQGPCAYTIHM